MEKVEKKQEKEGIEDIIEIIVAIFALVGLFWDRFKDGFDPMDPVKIFFSLQSEPIYKKAVEGMTDKVPKQAADLSIDEMFQIGNTIFMEAKNLVMKILGK